MNQEMTKTSLGWRVLNLILLVMQFLALPLHLALAVQDRQFWQESHDAFSGQEGAGWYYDIMLDWPIAVFALVVLGISIAKEFFRLPIGQRLRINAVIFLVMYAVPLAIMFQLQPPV